MVRNHAASSAQSTRRRRPGQATRRKLGLLPQPDGPGQALRSSSVLSSQILLAMTASSDPPTPLEWSHKSSSHRLMRTSKDLSIWTILHSTRIHCLACRGLIACFMASEFRTALSQQHPFFLQHLSQHLHSSALIGRHAQCGLCAARPWFTIAYLSPTG